MTITSEQLAQTLLAMSAEHEANTKKVVDTFVKFLEQHHLVRLVPNIMRHVERMAQHQASAETLSLTTPYKLSGAAVNKILKALGTESGVAVEKYVDESLIGGIVVKHNGLLYDGSVKGQLAVLRETLSA